MSDIDDIRAAFWLLCSEEGCRVGIAEAALERVEKQLQRPAEIASSLGSSFIDKMRGHLERGDIDTAMEAVYHWCSVQAAKEDTVRRAALEEAAKARTTIVAEDDDEEIWMAAQDSMAAAIRALMDATPWENQGGIIAPPEPKA